MGLENLYTEEELRLLAKTRKLREDIIDEVCADGKPPSDSRSARLLNEIANSLDSQIDNIANARIKHSGAKDAEQVTSVVAGILKGIKGGRVVIAGEIELEDGTVYSNREAPVLPSEYEIDSFVEGELEQNPHRLTMEDVSICGEDDDN